MEFLPLAGLRVLEISSFVAAPLGGMTLAQLGAEVIRIDPVGGAKDLYRWPLAPSGTSLYWTGLNKGKQSVEIDLRAETGRAQIRRMLLESGPSGGIVLTNAGHLDWLKYEALSQVRGDVIVVRIDGMPDGAPAVDYTVNAALGFPDITGARNNAGPINHVLPAWDVACGLYAAIAVLVAERQRRLTTAGQSLSVSLYDVALATAGNLGFLAEAQLGVQRQPDDNYVYGTFGRNFATADARQVMIVALTPRHWSDLVGIAGIAPVVGALETALGADFGTDEDRYEHREVLAGLLAHWFRSRTLAQVSEALASTSVLWSPYRSFTDLVANDCADLRAQPLLSTIEQPGVGALLAPGSPIVAPGQRTAARPAPVLGADTARILAALGSFADTR
ncbi:MAG: CoA transferase [Actinomycetota bacterium]|nr:CoA transferase [Actinomycetota bacterium]